MPNQEPENLVGLENQQLVVLYRSLLQIEERALREMRELAAASPPADRARHHWEDIAPFERLVEGHRARLARWEAALAAHDDVSVGERRRRAAPKSGRRQDPRRRDGGDPPAS